MKAGAERLQKLGPYIVSAWFSFICVFISDTNYIMDDAQNIT